MLYEKRERRVLKTENEINNIQKREGRSLPQLSGSGEWLVFVVFFKPQKASIQDLLFVLFSAHYF